MSASKCIKSLDGLRHLDGNSIMRSGSGPRRWGPLVACLLVVTVIAVGSSRPAHALQATLELGSVQTLVFDANCVPGQIACGDRNVSPPDSLVVDLSVSTTRIVSNVTHFALASLTAFLDLGDALHVSGVAQSDALRTPALPVPLCCMVGGEAFLQLSFDSACRRYLRNRASRRAELG